MGFLEIKNITKRFGNQTVLNNISAEIERGELVCILGPSGCGKTTLLRIIAGLETADSGQIFIDGKDSTFLPPAKRNFGIVFQSYALFPNMTVFENIMFGLRQKKRMNYDEREEKVLEVLNLVDLIDHKDKYPRELSGGQQQRTALARAVALSPVYLLLDEPLSALDAKVRARLRAEIRALQRKLGITTIMVTHDQEEALTMADRIIVMNNAVVEQSGKPQEIYNNPATQFVAAFVGTMNFYGAGEKRGIRPEKIKIVDWTEPHDTTALVQDVEFKGAFTRVHGILPERTSICIDVPSDHAGSMVLGPDVTLFLRLPAEHCISYPEYVEL
ncbi:ABC transporter ATP-binding protein [Spirochaetia bacterium]|nr:ABC transporter ATP-binding protein [Spirochaetia bacterium]